MLPARINLARIAVQRQITRSITQGIVDRAGERLPSGDLGESSDAEPSKRMQEFRTKMKLDPVPRVSPGMRFMDLMLVETNPDTGELISDSEKNPTKWGDWQHGGRVSDF